MATTGAFRPLSVLLVEDDDLDVRLMRRALQDEPYVAVDIARDGATAMMLLRSTSVDLVLLDLHLPGDAGFDVLGWIQENRPNLPVIVVTGTPEPEDRARVYALGASTFMPKPTEAADFQAFIRALFDFWMRSLAGAPRAADA